MDVTAVSSATHECLADLGLQAKGDIFALKAFCDRRQLAITNKSPVNDEKANYEDRKKKLLELLQKGNKRSKNVGENSSSTMSKAPVERCKTRKISLGWLHYSEEKERFVAVRLSGRGGTRRIDVGSHFSKDRLIEEGKKLFYSNGESSQGHADDMIFGLANFKGENIDIRDDEDNKQSFTVQNYIEMNKLTQVRLYLTSRRVPMATSDVESVDGEPPDESIKISALDNEKITIESESDDEVLMHPVLDTGATMTGSSDERQKISNIPGRLYQESLDNDRRKENKRSESKKIEEDEQRHLEQLRRERLERVPPEPSLGLPRVRIGVNHISIGKIIRSFSVSDNRKAVYDWVGSFALHPKHFNLSQYHGQTILPSDPVANVANCTLYMEVSTSPAPVWGIHEVTLHASDNHILPDTTR